jgi:hypothetical protein
LLENLAAKIRFLLQKILELVAVQIQTVLDRPDLIVAGLGHHGGNLVTEVLNG